MAKGTGSGAGFGTEGPPRAEAFSGGTNSRRNTCRLKANCLEHVASRGTPEGVLALQVLNAARAAEWLNDRAWRKKRLLSISPNAFLQWIHNFEHNVVDCAALLRRITPFSSQTMDHKMQTLANHRIGHGDTRRPLGNRRKPALKSVSQAAGFQQQRVAGPLAEAVTQTKPLG